MNFLRKSLVLFSFVTLITFSANAQENKQSFEISKGEFLLNGCPITIHSGEMHYPRIPKEYWRNRFRMMKALGLNAVATYVFWNYHNTAPGVWDFETGNRNLAEYIRIAGEEGLLVILRPGPYVCAEWEFGGYPWWLQQNKELVVRTNNQPFLDSCQQYYSRLADQVKDLQITKNGPIVLVQVENEFGSYKAQRKDIPLSEHLAYYRSIQKMLVDVGFGGPFFTSDATSLFQNGSLPQVLPTANGEGDISNLKKSIDTYYPGGPYMVAEYYPGWLDHWGEDFITVSPEESVGQVRKYLENGISFNIYMVHGGTNFGFTSGANYNSESDIQPDLTSYDYDAPISEAGWATSKYLLLRQEYQRFSQEPLPDIPIPIPVINLPSVQFNKTVDFFDWKNRISPVKANNPLCFEDLNQGSGYVLYSRQFTQPIQGTLEISGLRDYALVYVNGEKIGELNRMNKNYQMEVDIPSNGTLEILVENMGRINYGAEIVNNKKGIISPVTINYTEITGKWEMYPIPMNTPPDPDESTVSITPGNPAFYFARFDLDQTGDIFLDMSRWGKGIVFVNGHHLGRYWNIGPQQTLYLPGCWLKNNENEVVVFEQQNDTLQKELLSSPVPMLKDLRGK